MKINPHEEIDTRYDQKICKDIFRDCRYTSKKGVFIAPFLLERILIN